MMLRRPQNEPCKRVTLSIAPGESCGLQTPVILMARLLFHGAGNKSRRSDAVLDQGPQQHGRALHHILYCVNNVRCMWGERGPCVHSSRARRYTGRGSDRVLGCETDASIELSVIPPQTQTETARICISSVRHGIQSVCRALPGKSCSQWH